MTTGEWLLFIGIASAGLVGSAFFSGVETGIYTLNRVRLRVLSGRGDRRAQRLAMEIRRPNRLLSTLLLGNNMANYAGSYGIAAILAGIGLSQGSAVLFNALLLTPLLFVFGETLPKDLFRTFTDRWTYAVTPVLVFVRWVLTVTLLLPLVQAIGSGAARLLGAREAQPVAARQRISALIREGAGAGVLTPAQLTLADRALALRTHRIRREMVPWNRVTSLQLDMSPAERLPIVREANHTRLPVVDAVGKVVGLVHTLDVAMEPDRPTQELMHEILQLPADMKVVTALRTLRTEHRSIAVVVDPKTGRPRGIVTVKDLVEPLIGELAAW